MQERPELAPTRINADLLGFLLLLRTPRWFWIALGALGLLVGLGVATEAVMIVVGLQILGLTNVQYWAVLITNFIFWVGISHAGVMISAILRLTHAEWRRPITRSAEVLAIFALLTAALFPLVHTGRIWRTSYWVFPYDFTRGIWPDIRSALIWDPSAIVTYLTGTVLFVYVDLIPDLAVARDRAHGWRRGLYGVLSMGFRGTTRQWRVQATAGLLLAALILPVFVSVHSIVAWDLSMAILPGWHTTILAPYFVVGAVHSGVAGVVTVMCLLRWALGLRAYIRPEHFDTVGRVQIAVWFGYLFFFLLDFYFGLASRDPVEERIWELRFFSFPTNALMAVQVLAALVIPLPILFVRRWRRSPLVMLGVSIAINLGMWLERYILVVTPLSYKQPFVFTWVETYQPRPAEYIFTLAAFGLVGAGLLVFAKLLPIVPVWEVKEGQVVQRSLRVGRRTVPAAVHEE